MMQAFNMIFIIDKIHKFFKFGSHNRLCLQSNFFLFTKDNSYKEVCQKNFKVMQYFSNIKNDTLFYIELQRT